MQLVLPWYRLALALVAVIGLSTALAADRPAPDTPLLRELRGKVVLLDFWASWCGPCRESFPWMNDLQRRHGKDLVVLAVNVDRDRKLAEQFLAITPADFRLAYDPNGELATQFNVTGMPMSFVIDRHGRIRHAHRGFRPAQRVEREAALIHLFKE
jgi:cytochrome c biogenesis protein CcmG, thiol:disulfide interchange protein DsbE